MSYALCDIFIYLFLNLFQCEINVEKESIEYRDNKFPLKSKVPGEKEENIASA